MLPIERAHYNAWADRVEAALALAYPNTLWLVLSQDDIIRLPKEHDVLRRFRVIAMTADGGREVGVNVPFMLIVDEELFALFIVALGREVERRLAAMVEG